MTDDPENSPTFLSSLPSQRITDDIVKQIGESDNAKIRGAMGFPGSRPGVIEAFLLNMESKTHVSCSIRLRSSGASTSPSELRTWATRK